MKKYFVFLFIWMSLSAHPVLIDTDVGIDDALAIYALGKSPRAELVAITAVFGNVPVDQALENAAIVLDAIEKEDVALYRGSQGPLIDVETPLQGWPGHGANGLGGAIFPKSRRSIETLHAAEGMILESKKHTDLSILAIGPLTNLALAAKLDPTLPERIHEVVIMGGTMKGRGNVTLGAEFNFHADPEAAQIVLKAFAGKIRLVTWEHTFDNGFSWNCFRDILASLSEDHFLKRVTEHFISFCKNWPSCVLCDLNAALILLDPEIVRDKRELYGEIDLGKGQNRGAICFDWYQYSGKEPNLVLIESVKQEEMENLLKSLLISLP